MNHEFPGSGENDISRNTHRHRDIPDILSGEEDFLARILNAIADPVFVKDEEHRRIMVNDAYCSFLGRSREGMMHKTDQDLFSNDQATSFSRDDDKVFEAGTGQVCEELVSDRLGEVHTFLTKKTLLVDGSGHRFIVGIARDITGEKNAENALQESREKFSAHITINQDTGVAHSITDVKLDEEALKLANRKLSLLSNITRHDIRNQLLCLRGALELIDKDNLDRQTLELIKMTERSAEKIKDQIEFTKEYEDLGMKEPRWKSVADIIRRAKAQFLISDVAFFLPDEDFELFADPLLEKVFYNLLDNALRHGGKITQITLSCYESNAGLQISLTDNGRGVPVEEKLLIFEKGFGKNTGLGLFLSKEILSITGISIAEKGIFGKGAKFEISVPKGKYRRTGTGNH